MTITTPAPRVYVHGSLRTISDTAAATYVHASITDSDTTDTAGGHYILTAEAIHSQQADFPVSADGEWTAELVWAADVTYRLSCPGFMPDLLLVCDDHAAGTTVEADDLLPVPGP